MAIRGADGPGLHVLDVLAEDFKHLEGYEAAVAAREQVSTPPLNAQILPFTASPDIHYRACPDAMTLP